MNRVLCLLNHRLTEQQKAELESEFSVSRILLPPAGIQACWASIPTEKLLQPSMLDPFIDWIDDTSAVGDYLVIQGEFGSTVYMVGYAFSKGLVPLHSVTKRVAHEYREEEIVYRTYIFRHICFRKYLHYRANKEGMYGHDLHRIE